MPKEPSPTGNTQCTDRVNPHMARAMAGTPLSGRSLAGASILSGELGDAIFCLLINAQVNIASIEYPDDPPLAKRIRNTLEEARRAFLDAEDELVHAIMSDRASDNISRLKSFLAGICFAVTADFIAAGGESTCSPAEREHQRKRVAHLISNGMSQDAAIAEILEGTDTDRHNRSARRGSRDLLDAVLEVDFGCDIGDHPAGSKIRTLATSALETWREAVAFASDGDANGAVVAAFQVGCTTKKIAALKRFVAGGKKNRRPAAVIALQRKMITDQMNAGKSQADAIRTVAKWAKEHKDTIGANGKYSGWSKPSLKRAMESE